MQLIKSLDKVRKKEFHYFRDNNKKTDFTMQFICSFDIETYVQYHFRFSFSIFVKNDKV